MSSSSSYTWKYIKFSSQIFSYLQVSVSNALRVKIFDSQHHLPEQEPGQGLGQVTILGDAIKQFTALHEF